MSGGCATQPFDPDLSMPERVERLVRQFTALWWEDETDPPLLGQKYTVREQRERETQLERFQGVVTAEAKSLPRTAAERQATKERILSAFRAFAQSSLGFAESQMNALLDRGFPEVGTEFVPAARRFDPAIGGVDIFQALRNVWTMNGMQALLGLPVCLTPAIFAYSMLYPYTDNYLDDPAIPARTKREFNERFALRLAGEDVAAANAHERAIYDLVGMIEGQYERSRYPQVLGSLMAIHHAQCKSIELLRRNASPYEVDVLGISLEKGGTSVLADG